MAKLTTLEQMTCRIVSDGTGKGTRVYLPDGTDISHLVRSVSWEVDGGGVARANVGVFAAVEVTAGAEPVIDLEAAPLTAEENDRIATEVRRSDALRLAHFAA